MIAHAEPAIYVGTPVFFGNYVPKVAPCTYNTEARYGFCGWANYPEEGVVGISYDGGKTAESVNVRLYDEVICVNTVCKTNYGEPRGNVAATDVSYWYVPRGFYLADVGGKTTGIKYGNGPHAITYAIPPIQTVGLDLPDGVHRDGRYYEVFCNQDDECSYLGRITTYSDLFKYVPAVLTTNCDQWFCYTDNRIAGLNPKSPRR